MAEGRDPSDEVRGGAVLGRRDARRRTRERRVARRVPRLDRAFAFQASPLRRFCCVVRDVSDTGCRLVGADIDAIHSRFVLTVPSEGKPPQLCTVVWRQRRMIGVAFAPYGRAGEPPRPDADEA